MSRSSLRVAVAGLAVLMFAALSGMAQQNEDMSNKGRGASITGCVQKGEEPGGYILKADDGTTYELTSDRANLGEHVGHKVTLSGNTIHESKAEEQQKQTMEKKEAGDGRYSDFQVSDLKMVSDSCQ